MSHFITAMINAVAACVQGPPQYTDGINVLQGFKCITSSALIPMSRWDNYIELYVACSSAVYTGASIQYTCMHDTLWCTVAISQYTGGIVQYTVISEGLYIAVDPSTNLDCLWPSSPAHSQSELGLQLHSQGTRAVLYALLWYADEIGVF